MSYLNRFFQEVFDNNPLPSTGSSFDQATDAQMAAHLQTDQYDSFHLTEAIRPAMDLKIKPSQGYRHDTYVDQRNKSKSTGHHGGRLAGAAFFHFSFV